MPNLSEASRSIKISFKPPALSIPKIAHHKTPEQELLDKQEALKEARNSRITTHLHIDDRISPERIEAYLVAYGCNHFINHGNHNFSFKSANLPIEELKELAREFNLESLRAQSTGDKSSCIISFEDYKSLIVYAPDGRGNMIRLNDDCQWATKDLVFKNHESLKQFAKQKFLKMDDESQNRSRGMRM
jgi:hypothetical protein